MASYKDCLHWKESGITSRRKALRFGATTCSEAVNNRRCRRCPIVPEFKRREWVEEAKKAKAYNIELRKLAVRAKDADKKERVLSEIR